MCGIHRDPAALHILISRHFGCKKLQEEVEVEEVVGDLWIELLNNMIVFALLVISLWYCLTVIWLLLLVIMRYPILSWFWYDVAIAPAPEAASGLRRSSRRPRRRRQSCRQGKIFWGGSLDSMQCRSLLERIGFQKIPHEGDTGSTWQRWVFAQSPLSSTHLSLCSNSGFGELADY